MDVKLINTISTVVFFVILAVLVLVSAMTAYVFIRYGRSKNLTIVISLGFGGLFFLGVLTAFISLQSIF